MVPTTRGRLALAGTITPCLLWHNSTRIHTYGQDNALNLIIQRERFMVSGYFLVLFSILLLEEEGTVRRINRIWYGCCSSTDGGVVSRPATRRQEVSRDSIQILNRYFSCVESRETKTVCEENVLVLVCLHAVVAAREKTHVRQRIYFRDSSSSCCLLQLV